MRTRAETRTHVSNCCGRRIGTLDLTNGNLQKEAFLTEELYFTCDENPKMTDVPELHEISVSPSFVSFLKQTKSFGLVRLICRFQKLRNLNFKNLQSIAERVYILCWPGLGTKSFACE